MAILSPDPPACSKSQHKLSYPDPHQVKVDTHCFISQFQRLLQHYVNKNITAFDSLEHMLPPVSVHLWATHRMWLSGTCCLHLLPRRCTQQVALKYLYHSTKPHGVINQQTVIFIPTANNRRNHKDTHCSTYYIPNTSYCLVTKFVI